MPSPEGSALPDDEPSPIVPAPIQRSVNVDPAPKPIRKQAALVSSQITSQFSGPMPPPEFLARYEEICPGSADRMLAMAEKEADHRRSTETTIISAQISHRNKQFLEARCGQICALIITLAALGAGVYTAVQGHEIAGSVIGVGGIGGIVATFILGRAKQEESDEEDEAQPEPPPSRNRKRKDRRR